MLISFIFIRSHEFVVVIIQSTGTYMYSVVIIISINKSMTKHTKMTPFSPSFDNKVTRCLALVEQWELLQMNKRRKRNRARKEGTSGRDRKVKVLKEDKLEKDVVYIRNVVCDVEKDVEDKTE